LKISNRRASFRVQYTCKNTCKTKAEENNSIENNSIENNIESELE